MDVVFWLLWAVLFTAALLVVYKLVPVRGSRPRRRRAITRRCPACDAEIPPDAGACPHCGATSTPWIEHRESWWRREEDHYLWLDERSGEWRRYRRTARCPYCGERMPVDRRRCEACDRESNPLESPDPTHDLPI